MNLSYTGSGKIYYKEKVYKTDLYLNSDEGGILIIINVNDGHASYLELPLEINCFTGELSNGFKFTLINNIRIKMLSKVSEGITEFHYSSRYMINGLGGKDNNKIGFEKINFGIPNILEWGGISGYKETEDNGLTSNFDNTEINIFKNDDYEINYYIVSSMLPFSSDLLKENITLEQSGYISIKSLQHEKDLESFMNIYESTKKLIELSILMRIYPREITGFTKDAYFTIEEEKFPRDLAINAYIIRKNNTNDIIFSVTRRFLTLNELVKNNSFNKYFEKKDLLDPIFELYMELIYTEHMSPIRVFLNVIQALETYHSRFKSNNIKDFKKRIKEVILIKRPESYIEEDTKFLMARSRKFITLESRLADLLLAEFNFRFDIGDISYTDFPNIIAQTRHYYTHYDENIKKRSRVLTEEELGIYNRSLIYILEYYILNELGFINTKKIREKLNERWGGVSQTLSVLKASKDIINKEK